MASPQVGGRGAGVKETTQHPSTCGLEDNAIILALQIARSGARISFGGSTVLDEIAGFLGQRSGTGFYEIGIDSRSSAVLGRY